MVLLMAHLSVAGYLEPVRGVVSVDTGYAKELVFLTNRFDMAGTKISKLYKQPVAD